MACTCYFQTLTSQFAPAPNRPVEIRDADGNVIAQSYSNAQAMYQAQLTIDLLDRIRANSKLDSRIKGQRFGIPAEHASAATAVQLVDDTIDSEAKFNIRVNYSGKYIKIKKLISAKGEYDIVAQGTSVANQYVGFGSLPPGTYMIDVEGGSGLTRTMVAGQTRNEIFNVSAK